MLASDAPNIYLDIDGVLVLHDAATPHAEQFIEAVLAHAPDTTYWLSTRCKGDAERTVSGIERYFRPHTVALLHRVKPTDWDVAKTEAIDFSRPFLWFDDGILYSERQELHAHNGYENWIEIRLKTNPDQLKMIAEDFPLAIR